MKEDNKNKVLKMIESDMEADAKNAEGRPFNGETIGEYLGSQGAAIKALARIIRSILEERRANS